MIKSPIFYLVVFWFFFVLSGCQQTLTTKPKAWCPWCPESPPTTTPTNRQCFSTSPTSQRTKGSVFLLAAGANTGELTETSTDIDNFSQIVQRHFNIPKSQVCRLTNVFKAELENALVSLKQRLINDDFVIIYFSGHGGYIPDDNGDEKDFFDEALITYDVKGKDYPRVADILRDDRFTALVNAFPTDRVLTVMDTCFSSGMYLKESQPNAWLANARVKFFVKGEIGTQAPSSQTNNNRIIKNEMGHFDALEGLLLAAASEKQKALEIPNQGGLFTLKLVHQLKKRGNLRRAFAQAAQQVQETTRSGQFQQMPDAIGKWEVVVEYNK